MNNLYLLNKLIALGDGAIWTRKQLRDNPSWHLPNTSMHRQLNALINQDLVERVAHGVYKNTFGDKSLPKIPKPTPTIREEIALIAEQANLQTAKSELKQKLKPIIIEALKEIVDEIIDDYPL